MNPETAPKEVRKNGSSEASPFTDLSQTLATALADSYCTFLLTQNYHWNVEGPHFKSLHELFEEQYQEMFAAIDDVAERIRTLGFYAPGTFEEFRSLSGVSEVVGIRDGEKMVERLIDANTRVAKSFKKVANKAGEVDDMATEDLAIERIRVHEKNIWMLRSIVGGQLRTETKPN